MTKQEYKDKLNAILEFFKTSIITPNSNGSEIVTRYITSSGLNDEQWLGFLRGKNNGKTDIWLLTISELKGLGAGQKAVSGSTKRIQLAVDYFSDYRQGTDASNSEQSFRDKVFGVDFDLEKKQGLCGLDNIRLIDWTFKLKLKRFVNDTTHWAIGVINLELDIHSFN